MVCDNVVIGAGAVIPRGCVLSYGVVIGAGAVLKEYTRVSRHDGDDDEVSFRGPLSPFVIFLC